MGYPTFETNIDDQYTVTQNNAVGAENRGNVEITGTKELSITTIPQLLGGNNLRTLKEIIAYAIANAYDVITINLDHEFDELAIDIPDSAVDTTLQAGDGYDVKINLVTFAPAIYNYNTLGVRVESGCLKYEDSPAGSLYSPCCVDSNDDLYFLLSDGTIDTTTRSNISGKTYLAVDAGLIVGTTYYEETSLVNSAGTYQLYRGNTQIVSGITSIDTSSPKLKSLPLVPDGGTNTTVILLKSTSSGTIRAYDIASTQFNITVKKPDGTTFTELEDWWSDSQFAYGVDVATGIVDGSYISYIYKNYDTDLYKNTAYQDSNLIKTINAKMNTIYLNENSNITTGFDLYVGGKEIWYYDDANWSREQVLDFEPTHSRFIRAGNILYFHAVNRDSGNCVIYKKSTLDATNHLWTEVYSSTQTPYEYLSHYYDETDKELRILFRDDRTDKIYYFINKAITLSKTSRDGFLNGIVINENMVFADLGKDVIGKDISDLACVGCDDENDSFMTYCSIYADNIHATFNLWQINNNILDSSKNAMYYYGDLDPNYNGNNHHNLMIAGDSGVKFEIKSGDTIDFLTTSFYNNTIKATNGMQISGLDSTGETFKNCIIDATFYAINLNGVSDPLTFTNSILNGKLDTDVVAGSTNELNVNPLFKDVSNDDYHLMSIAEGYPKDSLGIGLGDDTKDAGCYDITYTNNGETEKVTYELTNYIGDISKEWEYTKKETASDYRGNYRKYMGSKTRIFKLQHEDGSIDLDDVKFIEDIIGYDDVIRFYPYGADSIPYIIDKSVSPYEYKDTETLTFSFTNLTFTTPANHYFEYGDLRGLWIQFTITATDYYFYITGNTDTVITVENKLGYTGLSNTTHNCEINFAYVKTNDSINYLNADWTDDDQRGLLSELKLYVVEDKEV